jgi:molecular chaperone GrpE
MIKKKKTDAEETAGGAQTPQQTTDDAPQQNTPTDSTAQLDALKAAAEKAAKERDEYLNLAQRVQADFDNFRRRNQNVRQEAYASGGHDMLVKLLPVFDNLERAASAEGSADALREGVQMVLRQLCGVLDAAGVQEITAQGEPFDPNVHNAVMQEEAPDAESGTVTAVLQKGYRAGDKILRHCMVKVAQ